MRHVVLAVLAVATAWWLAPFAHLLPPGKRHIEVAVIVAVFAAADVVIGRLGAARKRASARAAAPYAAPAKRGR